MKRFTAFTVASAAALGLAACGSEDVENTAIDDIDEIVDEDVEEPYPVGDQLSDDQQARYDETDWEAVSEEYDTNREAMMAESGMESSGDAMSSDTESMSADTSGMESGGATMTMPPRSEMTFSWLDRNGDGQLSVAEYAIWALPTNPSDPVPNDDTRPYLTQDQINEAGQTFFYFDDDGSTYLSESEFMDARNSGRTA